MTINLDTNKTFCPYPWVHSYLGSGYERKLCCISDDLNDYLKVPTSQFWNSNKMMHIRTQMINGEPVKECHQCYRAEQLKMSSLRQDILRHTFEDKIKLYMDNTDSNGFLKLSPNYFDYRTIQCNLHCISCGTVYSSKHQILRKQMYPDDTEIFNERDITFEKLMAEEIIESIRNKVCDSLYWAGGEPMISLVHWMVTGEISRLRKDPNYTDYVNKIHIHYNTNLTQLYWNKELIPELLKPSAPSIQASLDGTHETIEYTRDGCKWETIKQNWNEYHKILNESKQIGIASVLSSPVIMDIDRWFDFYEPYNPICYNHMYHCSPKFYPNTAAAFLDTKLFPKHIFERVVNHAIDRFKNTSLIGALDSVAILESYKIDRSENESFWDDIDMKKKIKIYTEYRDKFLVTKRPYSELLKLIDAEAYDWYMTL